MTAFYNDATRTAERGRNSVKLFTPFSNTFTGKSLIFKLSDKETGPTTHWKSYIATSLDLAKY